MSSYVGLAIFILWAFVLTSLIVVSEGDVAYFVVIIGSVFSLIIIALAALLDSKINKMEATNND